MFSFFFLGKKDNLIQQYSLKQISFFSAMPDAVLNNVCKKMRLVEYKKGDFVYKQGDVADSFFIVLSGRCRMFITDEKKRERNLAFFYKGDHFGEVSLLADKLHAATIEAKNDTMILKMNKEDFFALLQSVPGLSVQLSRRLGVRIKKMYDADAFKENAKIVSFLNMAEKGLGCDFVVNFAVSLVKETSRDVLIIDANDYCFSGKSGDNKKDGGYLKCLQSGDAGFIKPYVIKHKAGFDVLSICADDLKNARAKTAEFFTNMLSEYTYIIVLLPTGLTDGVLSIVEQSDLVYCLAEGTSASLADCKTIIDNIQAQFNLSRSELRVVLFEDIDSPLPLAVKEADIGWSVFFEVPRTSLPENESFGLDEPLVLAAPDDRKSRAVRFLARELGGKLVGLALGSGAAFGLAHIGVLKIIEREKIPIDIISGSSIGSVVGALWSAGYSAEEIEKIALKFTKKINLLQLVDVFDIAFPLFGFFRGKTVKRFMRKYLGRKTFAELAIPLRIVASDLTTSEDVIFKEGFVVDAIRASISIPGIVTPMLNDGRFIIDGGVTNPLPVNLLINEGVHKKISVNVLPSPQDILEAKKQTVFRLQVEEAKLQKAFFIIRWWKKFKIKIERSFESNIFNVLMKTVQYLESAVSSMQQADADVNIRPIIGESHWAEFFSPQKFILKGEEKAEEALKEIKKLVEE